MGADETKPAETINPIDRPIRHYEVKCCNGCGRKEVTGILYKCKTCSNYVLCKQCYKFRNYHAHRAMREIRLPLVDHSPHRSPIATGPSNNSVALFTAKWAPEKKGKTFCRTVLSDIESEYQDVINNMRANGGGSWVNKVTLISRIENYGLFRTYDSCRKEMERQNGPGFKNERILWHGTSLDVLTNIYRGGFNRSYCGKNATAYGNGVYFATSFDYSAQSKYSPPDANGQKFIFQCLVLTGYCAKGQTGLKEPPMRNKELRYDSVVDRILRPKMYVVFKDMQVYPQYVITLRV